MLRNCAKNGFFKILLIEKFNALQPLFICSTLKSSVLATFCCQQSNKSVNCCLISIISVGNVAIISLYSDRYIIGTSDNSDDSISDFSSLTSTISVLCSFDLMSVTISSFNQSKPSSFCDNKLPITPK